MKSEQDREEIIEAGRKIRVVSKRQFDSNKPEKKLKSVRLIGANPARTLRALFNYDQNLDTYS